MEGRPHNHGGKILNELGLASAGSTVGFQLASEFKPTGDQPSAIEALARGVLHGERAQTLLGVTGSGKTFSVANVIERVQRPTLVLSHNKTLAAQLYQEFKSFFPNNAVEYFVSYYDYYQPEAYVPSSDTFIEKDSSINEEIERLRISATSSLVSRRDVIVVASVSCIYGLGSPQEFIDLRIELRRGAPLGRQALLERLARLCGNDATHIAIHLFQFNEVSSNGTWLCGLGLLWCPLCTWNEDFVDHSTGPEDPHCP